MLRASRIRSFHSNRINSPETGTQVAHARPEQLQDHKPQGIGAAQRAKLNGTSDTCVVGFRRCPIENSTRCDKSLDRHGRKQPAPHPDRMQVHRLKGLTPSASSRHCIDCRAVPKQGFPQGEVNALDVWSAILKLDGLLINFGVARDSPGAWPMRLECFPLPWLFFK